MGADAGGDAKPTQEVTPPTSPRGKKKKKGIAHMAIGASAVRMMVAASLFSGVANGSCLTGVALKYQASGDTSDDFQSTTQNFAFLHVTFPEWLIKKAAEQEANPMHGQTIHQTNPKGIRVWPGGELKWYQEREHIKTQEDLARRRAWTLHRRVFPERKKLSLEEFLNTTVQDSQSAVGCPVFEDYPKDRRFMIDSGASYHMSGRKYLSAIEKRSIKMLECPVELHTANGAVFARMCATMYVQSLDLSVEVLIVPGVPPILSAGILTRTNNCSMHWLAGQDPIITPPSGIDFTCTMWQGVPLV